ncbi:MAG: diacylglycerol kinase family protein, partial [Aquaticitalea sp.]
MNTNRHLLIVINPKSGSNDKSELIQTLTNKILEKNWTYDLYETTGQDDGDAILQLIKNKSAD